MLSYNIERLLQQRYYHPGEKNWNQVVERVVEHVCVGESLAFKDRIKQQMGDRVWLPNSPTLVNSGKKNGGLAACFCVSPQEDTLESHFKTLEDIARIGKSGGGAGFGVYRKPDGIYEKKFNIRRLDAPVAGSAHGYAYGPNWYASLVSYALAGITQGGFRRMALMYSMAAEHPDIWEFLELKQGDDTKLTNFNQSVFISDDTMQKAVYDEKSQEHKLLWHLAENAWKNGEPGILFETRINTDTPYVTCGCEIQTVNPCSEQCLPNFGSCILASVNLAHDMFYEDFHPEDRIGFFNPAKLKTIIAHMTRFLDDVGMRNIFPTQNFEDWYNDHRPIGIGVMGYADALLRMGIEYGSADAEYFLDMIMGVIEEQSYNTSHQLGQEREVPLHCKAVNRRNITTTTIAPTGSISFLADCSSSIEPIIAPSHSREDERGEVYEFSHPYKDVAWFKSALNEDETKVVSWQDHVETQAIAQENVDSGVSKTINFPEYATVGDIYSAIVYAWETNVIKGLAVYRNNSRKVQVLTETDIINQDCADGECLI